MRGNQQRRLRLAWGQLPIARGDFHQTKLNRLSAAIVLDAHPYLAVGERAPIISFVLPISIVHRFDITDKERNVLAFDPPLFDAMFKRQITRRAEELVPFRLKQKLLGKFSAAGIIYLGLPRTRETLNDLCAHHWRFAGEICFRFLSPLPPRRERHQRDNQRRFPDQPAHQLLAQFYATI